MVVVVNQSMVAPIASSPKTTIAPSGVSTDPAEFEESPLAVPLPLIAPDVLLG